jgi:predicted MFS family arabinose efflux permease
MTSTAAHDPAPPLFTRRFVALTLAELAYFTADGLLIPTTPRFAAGPLGGDEVAVGLTYGAFAVTALLLRPFAGRLSDRRGRRPLLVGGALLFAAAVAAHTLTTTLEMLVVLRLVLGVAEAFFFVAAFAALADIAPPQRTGEALSYSSMALYLGIAFGPFIGELLLNAGGFNAAWMGGAALALTAALIALTLPETATPRQPGTKPAPLIHPAAIGPGLALCTGVAAMSGFFAFVTLHALSIGMDGSRLVLLVFGLTVVSCRVVFARLPDRVQPLRLGTVALTVQTVGLVLVAAFIAPIGLFAGAILLGIGVAFLTPAIFATIFARVRPEERGAASGTASAFIDLGFGGGPVLVGIVAGLGGIPIAFAAAGLLSAVGATGTMLVALTRRPAPARA